MRQGPFPSELFRSPPVVEDYEQTSGNGGPEIPVDGTAQNNYRATRWFRCKFCAAVVKERDLESHECS